MGTRALAQIILIIIAVVIVVTYIRPTIMSIQETQEQTEEYKLVLDSAEAFNSELQRLVNAANSFSASEMQALDRYLPETVDTIAVMRDINIIVGNNDMAISGLSTGEAGQVERPATESEQIDQFDELMDTEMGTEFPEPVGGQAPAPSDADIFSQQFQLSVTGSYEQFKRLLQDFERNAYPLAVAELSIGEGGDQSESAGGSLSAVGVADEYTFSLTLETYALNSSDTESQ